MTRETLRAPARPEAPGAAPDRANAPAAPAGRRPWHRTPTGEYALIALVFLGFLALWAGVARAMGLSSLVLPTPLVVWRALVEGLASGILLAHLWVTLQEILLGFLLGCCLGVGMGTLVAHSETAQRVLSPYLVASQAMPKLALAPIFVIWFGFGIAPKVVIAGLICFFPLLENTITGLNAVDETKLELFRMMTASPWQTFIRLRVPSALPIIFTGLRVAIVLSVVGAIVGEYVGANRGLGALIIVTQGNFDTPLMFAVFVVLTTVGTLLYKGMEVLERTLFAWRYLKREE